MSNEPRRTLVVDLDWLEDYRTALRTDKPSATFDARASTIASIIDHGTTVDMDHAKVAGFAQALVKAGREREAREVAEPEWAAKERAQERYYSEADFTEAEAHLETANILADADTMTALREAEADIAAGRVGPDFPPAGGAA